MAGRTLEVVKPQPLPTRIEELIQLRDELTGELATLPYRIAEIQREINKIALPSVATTVRQREVLSLLRIEESNKEIASHLNMSERTVKFHVSRLLAKFNVRTRREL